MGKSEFFCCHITGKSNGNCGWWSIYEITCRCLEKGKTPRRPDQRESRRQDKSCHVRFAISSFSFRCLTLVYCLGVQPFTAMVNKLIMSYSIHDWNYAIFLYGVVPSLERSSSMPVTHKAFELVAFSEFMPAASREIGT